jgi:hypothetical protein
MTETLPQNPDKPSSENNEGGRSQGGHFLAINHLHYHANDISELRKLAEVDPILAEKVIDQRDKENERIVGSYNLAVIATSVLLAFILGCGTMLIIFAGLIQTIAAVTLILAAALFMRVVLTGQWSDTSWFGKALSAAIKFMGGTPRDD